MSKHRRGTPPTRTLYHVEILELRRLNNSANGNGKWRMMLREPSTGAQHIRTTTKDSAIATILFERMVGEIVHVVDDGRGNIVDLVREVDATPAATGRD